MSNMIPFNLFFVHNINYQIESLGLGTAVEENLTVGYKYEDSGEA